jgi:hypothetical protein
MVVRDGYLLTTNPTSERTVAAKSLLEKVGFHVILVQAIPHQDKVLSNKISMEHIYGLIEASGVQYAYVFEDDVNVIKPVDLSEIVQYEDISEMFFYLGLCERRGLVMKTEFKINDHPVYRKKGFCRGLHAIGVSKRGCALLLQMARHSSERYMDVIVEALSVLHPANVCRYDLESSVPGHRGIFYQDRARFPSTI